MSQRLDILRHLATGSTITPLEAFKKFQCLSLSQRVTQLRAEGWPVKTTMVSVGAKRVARYSIPKAQRARAMVAA